jgi:hypothetical protein
VLPIFVAKDVGYQIFFNGFSRCEQMLLVHFAFSHVCTNNRIHNSFSQNNYEISIDAVSAAFAIRFHRPSNSIDFRESLRIQRQFIFAAEFFDSSTTKKSFNLRKWKTHPCGKN